MYIHIEGRVKSRNGPILGKFQNGSGTVFEYFVWLVLIKDVYHALNNQRDMSLMIVLYSLNILFLFLNSLNVCLFKISLKNLLFFVAKFISFFTCQLPKNVVWSYEDDGGKVWNLFFNKHIKILIFRILWTNNLSTHHEYSLMDKVNN